MSYKQLDILTYVPFDGSDIDQERDGVRLTKQILRVYNALKSGEWMTVQAIRDVTGDPECSISAQLRNLRKAKFGGFDIKKEHLGGGLCQYRMVI